MTIDKKIRLSIITFLVFGLIFLFFAIIPMFQEIKNNSNVLLGQKKITMNNEIERNNLEEFKVFSALSGESFKKIENLFVDSDLPLEFIQFLEGVAEKNNLQIEIWPASKTSSEDSEWQFLSFQVVLNGSFANFARFLEKIENSPYLVEIQNLNLSTLRDEAGNMEANLSIKVSVK